MDMNRLKSVQPRCPGPEHNDPMIELEAQMASLMSLHNATSDVNLATSKLGVGEVDVDFYTAPDTDFVSVIKFHGQPIPPPVLSLSCRLEMQAYKDAAVKKEREIMSRRRCKLLDTVQGIVDRFEVQKQASRESSPCDATEIQQDTNVIDSTQYSITLPGMSHTNMTDINKMINSQSNSNLRPPGVSDTLSTFGDTNITLPGLDTYRTLPCLNDTNKTLPDLSDTNITLPGLSDTDKFRYNQAIEEREQGYVDNTPTILQEIDDMLGTKLCDDLNASVASAKTTNGTHPTETTELVDNKSQSIPPVVSNSVSSSEESALNRTVIPADDDGEQSFNAPFQSTAIKSTSNNELEQILPNQEALQKVILDRDGNMRTDSLRESWAESESNMSLIGEYHLLPTPSPDINSDLSVSQKQSNNDLEKVKETSDADSGIKSRTTPEDKEYSTLSGTQTLSGTHSTQLTLDTLAQSCTLPLSLFSSSSNSTLCEVQDPFTSYTDQTTPFEATGEQGRLTRGAPVGQESSNTESGSEPQEAIIINNKTTMSDLTKSRLEQKHSSPEDGTSNDDFKSPRKRVRRNSYTLDHPSPALLDAKARNEAPYASDEGSPQVVDARRSLDLAGEKQATQEVTKLSQVYRPNKYQDQQKNIQQDRAHLSPKKQLEEASSLTEDNLLRLQMEQFEQLRKQMEEKQKRQLAEMLLIQQQEQLSLQQEMSTLELRFNEQNSSKIYSSVFGLEDPIQDVLSAVRIGNSPGGITGKERHSSDATVPSLRDSLENALPPISSSVTPYSHTSPAIHTHTSHIYMADSSPNHGHESCDSTPFYLEHDKEPIHNRSIDLDYMDVERSALSAWTPASGVRTQKINNPSMQAKFERVSAAVKGYLTRRLMRTNKVQSIIQTIRDTVYFVDDFQAETPIKNGRLTPQDVQLAERLLSQLSTARNELYDTFQTLPARDRMSIITQSRTLEQQELFKTKQSPDGLPSRHTPVETKPLSTATLKALQRKNKAKKMESIVSAPKQTSRPSSQKGTKRPKSVGDNRVLRPLQGNQSPPGPVGAPFRFTASTANDSIKSKPVIHRQPTTNRNVTKAKPKSAANTTTNTAAGKKTKSVRRSLYPATTGVSRAPAKSTTKGTRTVLNKK